MLRGMYLDGDGVEKFEPCQDMLAVFRKFLETVQVHKGDNVELYARIPLFFPLGLTVRAMY